MRTSSRQRGSGASALSAALAKRPSGTPPRAATPPRTGVASQSAQGGRDGDTPSLKELGYATKTATTTHSVATAGAAAVAIASPEHLWEVSSVNSACSTKGGRKAANLSCESTQSTSTVATVAEELAWRACQERRKWSEQIISAASNDQEKHASARAAAALARQGAASKLKLEESAAKANAKVKELTNRCEELSAALADCEELRAQDGGVGAPRPRRTGPAASPPVKGQTSVVDEPRATGGVSGKQAQRSAEHAQQKRQQLLAQLEELIGNSSPVLREFPQAGPGRWLPSPALTLDGVASAPDELDEIEAAQELHLSLPSSPSHAWSGASASEVVPPGEGECLQRNRWSEESPRPWAAGRRIHPTLRPSGCQPHSHFLGIRQAVVPMRRLGAALLRTSRGFSTRAAVKAVTCVDGQPQSVYRATKVAEAVEAVKDAEAAALQSVEDVAKVVRDRSGLGDHVKTQVASVLSTDRPQRSSAVRGGSRNVVALGSHGPGRVLHKSLASYLMQSYADTRILVCPLKEWQPTQPKGLKYTVVFDGCQTSRNALEFRATVQAPSEEELQKALADSNALFDEAASILRGRGETTQATSGNQHMITLSSIKEVLGTHLEVLPGQQLGEQLLDKAIGNGCDVLVAGTKAMPGIGSFIENMMKGRTVMGVLTLGHGT
eukprot:g6316.t1